MDIQRLRNLTTHMLHTKMDHICLDVGYLTGMPGVMPYMLPNAVRAMEPWLRDQVHEPRFWDGLYDTEHVGDLAIEPMTPDEWAAFLDRHSKLPSLLAGKKECWVTRDMRR